MANGAAGKRVRTPTRLQMEATECGAAALAIVLEYHGSFVPLAQLRQECGVSRDGSKASNILKAARTYGMEAKGFRKEPSEMRELQMPVIAHWNFNHFLVIEGFGRGKVYLNDPATGPRVVTDEEFDHAFTGVALTFVPTADFKVTGKRPALLPSLLRRLSGTKAPLLFIILAGLGLVLPGLVIPIFSKVFVDSVLVGGKHEWLPALLIGMAGTAVLRAALTWLQRAYLLRLVMKLAVSMASGFMWHVLRLPVPFFFARSEGDLASRVQLNDQVAHMLSGELSSVALDMMLVGFYGVLMLYFDPLLTSIGVATAIVHVVLLRLAERMRTDLSRRVAQEGGKLAGVAAGGLTMIETLKATGAESAFFSQWAGHQAKVISAQQQLARREQLLNAAVSALSQINDALVLGVGALRVMDGHMSVGTLVAFQSLMSSFIRPIESLAAFGATLQTLRGSIERLDDVLGHERDSSIEEHSNGESPSARRLTGELELRDVTFGYLPFAPALVSELDA
jgi:ABC-type bacteriocin/lantibiotic exporter with double-glycine peptidase domain